MCVCVCVYIWFGLFCFPLRLYKNAKGIQEYRNYFPPKT